MPVLAIGSTVVRVLTFRGVGVIPGGTTGQVLKKASNADFDAVWGANGTGVGGGAIVVGETPTGLVNGANATYTSLTSFTPGTVEVFVNGLAQRLPTDFNTSGVSTIILTSSPATGESIRINYRGA